MRRWPILLVVGCTSCDIHGLVDDQRDALLDPAGGYFGDAVRVVEGSFHDVSFSTYDADGPRILVRTTEKDGEHLRALSVDWGAALQARSEKPPLVECDAGLVTEHVLQRDPARDGLEEFFQVRFDEDGDGFGSIGFFDFSCREFARLEDVESSTYSTHYDDSIVARRDFARTRDGGFYEIFYDERAPRLLLEDVSFFDSRSSSASEPGFWLIRDGELVRFDLTRNEVTIRVGRGVTSLSATWEGGVLFTDEDGIAIQELSGTPLRVAANGCNPVRGRVDGRDVVVYFDPCDERRVHLTTLSDDRIHVTGGVVDGELRFVTHESPSLSPDQRRREFLLGTTHGSSSGPGYRVYAGLFSTTPGEEALELEWLDDHVTISNFGVSRNFDGTSGDYVIPEFDDLHSLRTAPTILENVVAVPFEELGYRIFAADFDGKQSSLYRVGYPLFNDLNAEPLGVDVLIDPEFPQSLFRRSNVVRTDSPIQYAFVSPGTPESKGRSSTELRTWIIPEGEEPVISEPLAKNVRPGSPIPLSVLNGIAYLSNDARRELRVYLEDSALDQALRSDVAEFFEIRAPSPGVVSVVSEGKSRGIWFSKIR